MVEEKIIGERAAAASTLRAAAAARPPGLTALAQV